MSTPIECSSSTGSYRTEACLRQEEEIDNFVDAQSNFEGTEVDKIEEFVDAQSHFDPPEILLDFMKGAVPLVSQKDSIRVVGLHPPSHSISTMRHDTSSLASVMASVQSIVDQQEPFLGDQKLCSSIDSLKLQFPETDPPLIQSALKHTAKFPELISGVLEKSAEAMRADLEPIHLLPKKIEILPLQNQVAAGSPLSSLIKWSKNHFLAIFTLIFVGGVIVYMIKKYLGWLKKSKVNEISVSLPPSKGI